MIAARQGLSALWEAAVLWPTQVYAARGAWPGRFIEVGTYLLSLPVVALLPLAGVAVLSGWRHQHREIVVLLAWIGLIFGVIIWNGHFLPYHWHPLFPPLAILTARAMAGDDRLWGRTSLTVALLVLGIAPLRQIARWARLETGRLTPDAYRALLLHEHFPTRTPIDSLIGYVRRTTSEQDGIFLWGENPALYALSGRRSASRFGSSRPLIEGPESPLTSRFRGELLTQLRASPPRLFLRHESGCEGDPGLVMSCTPLFPELQRFVDSGYVADTVVSDMVVFRRR